MFSYSLLTVDISLPVLFLEVRDGVRLSRELTPVTEQSRGSESDPGTGSCNFQNNREHNKCAQVEDY